MWKKRSTFSKSRHSNDVSGKPHALVALSSIKHSTVNCTGGWVGPKHSLDIFREKLLPLPEFELRMSSRSHSTEHATSACIRLELLPKPVSPVCLYGPPLEYCKRVRLV